MEQLISQFKWTEIIPSLSSSWPEPVKLEISNRKSMHTWKILLSYIIPQRRNGSQQSKILTYRWFRDFQTNTMNTAIKLIKGLYIRLSVHEEANKGTDHWECFLWNRNRAGYSKFLKLTLPPKNKKLLKIISFIIKQERDYTEKCIWNSYLVVFLE